MPSLTVGRKKADVVFAEIKLAIAIDEDADDGRIDLGCAGGTSTSDVTNDDKFLGRDERQNERISRLEQNEPP